MYLGWPSVPEVFLKPQKLPMSVSKVRGSLLEKHMTALRDCDSEWLLFFFKVTKASSAGRFGCFSPKRKWKQGQRAGLDQDDLRADPFTLKPARSGTVPIWDSPSPLLSTVHSSGPRQIEGLPSSPSDWHSLELRQYYQHDSIPIWGLLPSPPLKHRRRRGGPQIGTKWHTSEKSGIRACAMGVGVVASSTCGPPRHFPSWPLPPSMPIYTITNYFKKKMFRLFTFSWQTHWIVDLDI